MSRSIRSNRKNPSAPPVVLGPGEGRQFLFGRRVMTVKAEASTAPFAVCEADYLPGTRGAPLHRHRKYTEAFYVLAGEMEFLLDDQALVCPAGSFVLVPRGVAHGFRNRGSHPARMLLLVQPADGLRILEEVGATVALDGPAWNTTEVQEVIASHSTELVEADV